MRLRIAVEFYFVYSNEIANGKLNDAQRLNRASGGKRGDAQIQTEIYLP